MFSHLVNSETSAADRKALKDFNECFPSRASFSLFAERFSEQVGRMKEHVVNRLPSRKLLNYTLTGASIQYLCYEICLVLNEKSKKELNL